MVSPLARTSISLSMALALPGCASKAGPSPSSAPAARARESPSKPLSEASAHAPTSASAIPNSADALAERLDRITAIEISDGANVIASLDQTQIEAVSAELAEASVGSLSVTSPPWPGYFALVHVDDRPEPFVASVVVVGGLRLNARAPYALAIADANEAPDLHNIAELSPCDAMWDVMIALLGSPASKEYQRPPAPPF